MLSPGSICRKPAQQARTAAKIIRLKTNYKQWQHEKRKGAKNKDIIRMGKIGKCPWCPPSTKPVLLINGGCPTHQDIGEKKAPTVKEILTVAPKKKAKPIKKVATKTAKINQEYSKLKKQYMAVHPNCEAMVLCSGVKATEIHHKAGRGKNMLNTDTWMATCHRCHRWIHDNDAEAREKRFLLSKHKK